MPQISPQPAAILDYICNEYHAVRFRGYKHNRFLYSIGKSISINLHTHSAENPMFIEKKKKKKSKKKFGL